MKITWQIVLIVVAILASINIALIATTDAAFVAPLVNLAGIVLVALFARDSVQQNQETHEKINKTAQHVDETAARVFELRNDPEHVATVARIAALENAVHGSKGDTNVQSN